MYDAFVRKYVRHTLLVFGVILLSFIWIFTNSRIRLEKEIVFEAAIANSRDISSIVALNLEHILNKAELYAKVSANYLEGGHSPASILTPGLVGDRTYLRLAVFDMSGALIYSSASRRHEPEMEPLVRDMLKLGYRTESPMGIGQAGTGTAAWRVPMALPLISIKGERMGFLAAILDLGYFLQLYKELELGDAGYLGIFTDRGTQLVELNRAAINAGPSFSSSIYGPLVSKSAHAGTIMPDGTNGKSQDIGTFQFVGNYPLAITVLRSRDGILNNFHQRQRSYLAWAMIASLIVVIVLGGLALLVRRQQKLLMIVTQSENERKRLLIALESEKSRAYQLASHDYLTGIPNRMLFHDMAQAELARAKRSRNIYALLFLDLNNFKLINDTLGHAVGDLLLQAVAQRLRQTIRAYDIVSRLGGDEFVILLSEMRSVSHVEDVAEKVIAAISEPYKNLDRHDIEISTSVGIALHPQDGTSVDTLLLHADAAMYQAKSRGAGRYYFYDALLKGINDRHRDLLSRLRPAIKQGEFCLHFQPKIDLDSFAICGLEALVRWQHPKHGLIPPVEFIELAERNDLINRLGNWIINEVCRQIAAWQKEGIEVPPIAINISAKQIVDESIVDTFCAAVEKHGIAAGQIEIEITESCLIEDIDVTKGLLERLRDYGTRISIDDYGTGFSALSSLKKLPIYAIKIDKSFVRGLRNDVDDAMIVDYTISLAHNLGLIVVAEGVETKEQAVHLKTAGCDQVQGYYFQRPLSATDIVPIIRKRYVHPETPATPTVSHANQIQPA